MKIKDGKVEITTLKQNVKTMLEEPHTRIVEPLDLPILPNLGKEIVADLESGKIKIEGKGGSYGFEKVTLFKMMKKRKILIIQLSI